MEHTGKPLRLRQFVDRYVPLMTVQIIWLVSFQFLGLHTVYSLLFLPLVGLFLWLTWKKLADDDRIDLQMMAVMMAMFTISMATSLFYLETDLFLRQLLLAMTLPVGFILGYLLSWYRPDWRHWILQGIILAFSGYLFINLITTLYRYLPFYRWIYPEQVIYVNGEVYQIANEVKWWLGLGLVEVNIAYVTGYLTLLWMPFLAWIMTRFFGQRFQGRWILIPTIVALLMTVLLPLWQPFLLASLIGLFLWFFILLNRWQTSRPTWYKTSQWVIWLGLFMIVGLFIIDAYQVEPIRTLIQRFRPLNLIFNYRLVEGYQAVLRAFPNQIFGGFWPLFVGNQVIVSTQSIIFDALYQGGVFSFAGLVLLITFTIRQYGSKLADKPTYAQWLMMVWVIAFFVIQSFVYPLYPFVREEQRWIPRLILDEPLWMMTFFLLGLSWVDKQRLVNSNLSQETTPHTKKRQLRTRHRQVVKDE
jgi:hypothetical protein